MEEDVGVMGLPLLLWVLDMEEVREEVQVIMRKSKCSSRNKVIMEIYRVSILLSILWEMGTFLLAMGMLLPLLL